MKLSAAFLSCVLAQDGPFIDCAPEGSLDKLGLTAQDHENLCSERKCTWTANSADAKYPKCTYPADYKHYTMGKPLTSNGANDKSERYSLSLHAEAQKDRFAKHEHGEPAIEKLQGSFEKNSQ